MNELTLKFRFDKNTNELEKIEIVQGFDAVPPEKNTKSIVIRRKFSGFNIMQVEPTSEKRQALLTYQWVSANELKEMVEGLIPQTNFGMLKYANIIHNVDGSVKEAYIKTEKITIDVEGAFPPEVSENLHKKIAWIAGGKVEKDDIMDIMEALGVFGGQEG